MKAAALRNGADPVVFNERSLGARKALAAWRKALAAGDVPLADLFRECPECFAKWSLLELVVLGRRWGRQAAIRLNAHAIEEGLNLAVALTDADADTIEWLVRAVEAGPGAHVVPAPTTPLPPRGRRHCTVCRRWRPVYDFPRKVAGQRIDTRCVACKRKRAKRRYAETKKLTRLNAAPFREFLRARVERHGITTAAVRLCTPEKVISRVLDGQEHVNSRVVDRALVHDGALGLYDLYPELYE